jgi:hypothetical protein
MYNGEVSASIKAINYREKGHLEELAKMLKIDFKSYLLENTPYLSSEEIRFIIDEGFFIGAHSIDHPRYAELSLDEQVHQTVESLRFVTERFNLTYRLFAFPYEDIMLTKEFYSKIRRQPRQHMVPSQLRRQIDAYAAAQAARGLERRGQVLRVLHELLGARQELLSVLGQTHRARRAM